jgi:CRISPR/Cas system-associated protein Csx1
MLIKNTHHLNWMQLIKKFLYEKHHLLKNYYFDAEVGMLAMNAESEVALAIIKEFTRLDKPILTIYDSFVVKEEDKSLLTETMVNCYYQRLGFHPFFKIVR